MARTAQQARVCELVAQAVAKKATLTSSPAVTHGYCQLEFVSPDGVVLSRSILNPTDHAVAVRHYLSLLPNRDSRAIRGSHWRHTVNQQIAPAMTKVLSEMRYLLGSRYKGVTLRCKIADGCAFFRLEFAGGESRYIGSTASNVEVLATAALNRHLATLKQEGVSHAA